MIYPIISNQYYRIVQEGETLKFIKAQSKLDDAEIKERLELAKAYNETLDPSRLSDPYTDKEKRIAAYAKMLELKEMIGYIDIPKIDQKIPVYAGTFEEVLQKGLAIFMNEFTYWRKIYPFSNNSPQRFT